ncbi:uncharacterized protein LOC114711760, partial [Neltuma alba]|uniref:uncharacterized protein LOC114711760 n=1 Tax=Neltuma alba TaxID=207710 RepID=UPI0010A4FB61
MKRKPSYIPHETFTFLENSPRQITRPRNHSGTTYANFPKRNADCPVYLGNANGRPEMYTQENDVLQRNTNPSNRCKPRRPALKDISNVATNLETEFQNYTRPGELEFRNSVVRRRSSRLVAFENLNQRNEGLVLTEDTVDVVAENAEARYRNLSFCFDGPCDIGSEVSIDEYDNGDQTSNTLTFIEPDHTSMKAYNGKATQVAGYVDIGDPTFKCQRCGALMWFNEKVGSNKYARNPSFSMYCLKGKVQLPPLDQFVRLFFDKKTPSSRNFLTNIRTYNNMFSFTSMGGKIDYSKNSGGGPYSFVLSGINYHRIGSLLPPKGSKLFTPNCTYMILTMKYATVYLLKHMKESAIDNNIVDHIKKTLDDANLLRDVIVHKLSGLPQRIDELHPFYLPLQYPILFPRGEDGYRDNIEHREETLSNTKKKRRVSIRESSKLLWVRTHQKELRADLYQGLTDALLTGRKKSSSRGKRYNLPSSFTGGARYMVGNYKDAMAICRWAGRILCRVFHIKLKALMDTIKKKKIFGTVIADVHTIEFQKRGLPHAHILLFLDQRDQPKYPEDVDRVISAEIPNLDEEPQLYDLVKRRRDDGRTIEVKGIPLDNRFIVPYNPTLLSMFEAHINVEKCNQSSAIKRPIDEIQQYYNFRYISACEAAWRIFAFDIHHRYPAVERLSFHLPNQQCVVYSNADDIEDLLNKRRVCESMFLTWMKMNHDNDLAKTLTYSEFPQYFVYQRSKRCWKIRQKGFAIGRITHVSPSSGELYYLRILLTKVRGPSSFEKIRTVDGVVHSTFRATCFALGLLHDDSEYINAIKEASVWASGRSLRK